MGRIQDCHCLCVYIHPLHNGICTGEHLHDVEVNRGGLVEMLPMCAPCRQRYMVYAERVNQQRPLQDMTPAERERARRSWD